MKQSWRTDNVMMGVGVLSNNKRELKPRPLAGPRLIDPHAGASRPGVGRDHAIPNTAVFKGFVKLYATLQAGLLAVSATKVL